MDRPDRLDQRVRGDRYAVDAFRHEERGEFRKVRRPLAADADLDAAFLRGADEGAQEHFYGFVAFVRSEEHTSELQSPA